MTEKSPVLHVYDEPAPSVQQCFSFLSSPLILGFGMLKDVRSLDRAGVTCLADDVGVTHDRRRLPSSLHPERAMPSAKLPIIAREA